jgi:hypothetical protein
MDVHGKKKKVAREKNVRFVLKRKIEEKDTEEDEKKHFLIGACPEKERIVKKNFYKGEVRQDENQEEVFIDIRFEDFVEKK